MRIPPWARWALAVVLVLGVAAVGVAANLAVLGSTTEDTALGTLNAGSLAPTAQPPAGGAGAGGDEAIVVAPSGSGQADDKADERPGRGEADDDRSDERDDSDDD